MINPQWLELPMSLTHFHGPKHFRAIEVYIVDIYGMQVSSGYLETRFAFKNQAIIIKNVSSL